MWGGEMLQLAPDAPGNELRTLYLDATLTNSKARFSYNK